MSRQKFKFSENIPQMANFPKVCLVLLFPFPDLEQAKQGLPFMRARV